MFNQVTSGKVNQRNFPPSNSITPILSFELKIILSPEGDQAWGLNCPPKLVLKISVNPDKLLMAIRESIRKPVTSGTS